MGRWRRRMRGIRIWRPQDPRWLPCHQPLLFIKWTEGESKMEPTVSAARAPPAEDDGDGAVDDLCGLSSSYQARIAAARMVMEAELRRPPRAKKRVELGAGNGHGRGIRSCEERRLRRLRGLGERSLGFHV